jgi:riboflavin synthase
MFTGIVRYIGTVKAVSPTAAGRRLGIDLGPLVEGLKLGDSIAVSGACLTAAAVAGSVAQFDVIAETLAKTTLGTFQVGRRVNLEPALRVGQGLDGHMVQGHVDGSARLAAVHRGGQHVL